jgi:hypothetical protein
VCGCVCLLPRVCACARARARLRASTPSCRALPCKSLTSARVLTVCGSSDGDLRITDNGDGTCSAIKFTAGASSRINCSSLAYGAVCNSLLSSVTITMRRTSSGPYQQPNINQWLRNMGLASVGVLAQALTVLVDHSPLPVPPYVFPFFFTNLTQACPPPSVTRALHIV